MIDSLTSSANGLIVLIYIIALVVFFLYGPHKVYESIFGVLIGLGCYLFIHEMTFVVPEFTRTLFGGTWLYDNRGSLLWGTKVLTGILFFITPMTLGLNVAGVIRGSAWFFFKVFILSAFFVCFGFVLLLTMYQNTGVFGQVVIFPASLFESQYWTNSSLYIWIIDRSYTILVVGFLLGFYKILFSHWINKIALLGGAAIAKGNEVFGKKTFDTAPVHGADEHGDIGHGDTHDAHADHEHH